MIDDPKPRAAIPMSARIAMLRERLQRLAATVGIVALVYLMVSVLAYRFRHPELTETQLLLATGKALRWEP